MLFISCAEHRQTPVWILHLLWHFLTKSRPATSSRDQTSSRGTPSAAKRRQRFRIAAHALGGAAWANALTGLVALALATSVSSMMMAGPRVYARMAVDGCLPRWLATDSGPPLAAVLFQCLVALAMLWSATYDRLLTYIGFTLSLSTAATVVGLMVLRRREGPQLAVPGWPWVPGLFVLAVLWMAFFSVARRPVESLVGFATIGVGWVAWRMNRRSTSSPPC